MEAEEVCRVFSPRSEGSSVIPEIRCGVGVWKK